MCVFKGVSHSSALSEKATPISKDSPSGPRCLSIASLKQFQGASADKFSELELVVFLLSFLLYIVIISVNSLSNKGEVERQWREKDWNREREREKWEGRWKLPQLDKKKQPYVTAIAFIPPARSCIQQLSSSLLSFHS